MGDPVILSIEVCSRDDSEYRVLIDGLVKYVTIAPGTFDRPTLSTPLDSISGLLDKGNWNMEYISRDQTRELKATLQSVQLAGVQDTWHSNWINCLELARIKQLTGAAFEASYASTSTSTPGSSVIAKIARFEWEIPRIEQETRAYRMLENTGIAPRFLGHIHEHGRVMGLLLEKVEGRPAGIEDLSQCRSALQRFHDMGLVHGDINRYNFIIHDTVRLIDFERSQICSGAAMQTEMASLRDQLMEDSGRGGGFMFEETG